MLLLSFIVAFVLIVLYTIYLLKRHSNSIPFLVLFLVYLYWCFISIVYIDNGTYISEQGAYSYFTGASFRFVILMLPFILGAPLFFDFFTKKAALKNMKMHLFKVKEQYISIIIWLLSFLLCLYLILDEIISGIPLFNSEILQFNYYSTFSKLPMTEFLSSLFLGYMLLICGVFFCENKRLLDKFGFISIYLLAIIYRILLGEKFYPFILYTIIFFMPTIIDNFDKQYRSVVLFVRRNSKLIIRLCLLMFILIGVAYYKYSLEESYTYANPFEHLISRIFALQSHTFWGLDNYMITNNLGFDADRIIKEIHSGVIGTDILNSEYGLARIMYIISPESIVDMYLSRSTRFYGGYWTIAVSCFGFFLAPIYSIFVAFLFGFISSILYTTIKNKEYIVMFIAFNAYFNLFKYFNEGDFAFLLSKRMIVAIILLIFYILIKNAKYKKIAL